ncbi:MAG TPA: PIG-L family deacetylase [Caulobacteraceae bacterium]|nr:PIG-L family deacetylase [Caulobacteraceae bacterium]
MALDFGRSILIIAPHPDDEVVACCAAIGRARATGATVRVIFITHGCVSRETMWPWARARYGAVVARRRAEADAVLAKLGLGAAGWSDRPARALWRHLPDAEAEIRQAVARYAVDQLWAPAFEGGNADHDAANAIAAQFAAAGLSVLEFAEYNLSGGRVNSHAFPVSHGDEVTLDLTAEERAAKRQALALYASERQNLSYVKVEREVFRPLPAHDYAAPPHPGRLWYARFQWVPFRHPGVDFTQPSEVARALAAYRAAK